MEHKLIDFVLLCSENSIRMMIRPHSLPNLVPGRMILSKIILMLVKVFQSSLLLSYAFLLEYFFNCLE